MYKSDELLRAADCFKQTKMPGIPLAAADSERPAAIIICRDQLLYSYPSSTKFSTQKTMKLLQGLTDVAQALTDQHAT